MILGERQEKFSRDVAALLARSFELGFECRIGEAQRTLEQQKIYFAAGKSKTMFSKHLDKLAIDLFFTKNGRLVEKVSALEPIGKYWETLRAGNKWGGHFASFIDTPHFEAA
ncbi:MAG: M15 family metallopeptidase [Rickettsiales bacterium]|jgi:hypothetical protein|nr:M15 family metallopeptidase [Rickettsiales bacterium]